MGVKFQEGWQNKKSVSTRLHARNADVRKSARAAEKATLSSAHAADRTVRPQDAKKPVSAGKDAPQTNQTVKHDTQGQQAARAAHAEKAANQMAKVKSDAGRLSQLSSKIATPKGTDNTVTRNPVTGKSEAPQANVKQGAGQTGQPIVSDRSARTSVVADAVANNVKVQPDAPKAKGARKPAQKDAGKNAADGKNAAKDIDGAARAGAAAQNAALAGAQNSRPVLETARTGLDDVDSEDDGFEEDLDSNRSTFRAGNRRRATERELGGVLSGFSGEGESGDTDGETSAAGINMDDVPELPETPDSLPIFNEFDSTVKDAKYAAQTKEVYIRLVEKRITEIAKLDRELDGKIRDMFDRSLSDRIFGECADELKAKTAYFLQSVNGGIVG